MGVFFNDIDLAEKCWYQNLYLQMIEIQDDPTFITEDESLRTFSCYVELHRNGQPSKSINGKCIKGSISNKQVLSGATTTSIFSSITQTSSFYHKNQLL